MTLHTPQPRRSLLRGLLRLFAILLGTVGLIAMLALAAVTWTANREAQKINQNIVDRLDERLEQLEQRSEDLQRSLDTSNSLLDEFRTAMRDAEMKITEKQVRQRLLQLQTEVRPTVEHAELFLHVTLSTLELLKAINDELPGVNNPATEAQEKSRTRAGVLVEVQTRIESLLAKLNEAREQLLGLVENPERIFSRSEVLSIAVALIGRLDAIQERLTEMRASIETLREHLRETRQEIDWGIEWVAIRIVAFALWMALGQYALARHLGRKRSESLKSD